jgi:hypothetical protein
VYFHDEAGLHRVGKSGGAVTDVYPLKNFWAPDLGAFGANDDGVTFWQSHPNPPSSTFDVLHVGPFGGAPVKLATLPWMAGRGTVDSRDRTFVIGDPQNGQNSSVFEVAPDGTTSQVVSSTIDASLVRSDGTDTYFAGSGGIFRATTNGPLRLALFFPYVYFTDFIFDGPTIYFTANDVDENVIVGAVSKHGDTTNPTILWSGRVLLSGMDQDATYVYAADRGTPAILRIRKDGAGSEQVITGVNAVDNFNDVKVDDKCIYYSYVSYAKSTAGTSSVIAMPK